MSKPTTMEEFFTDWCRTALLTEQQARDMGLPAEVFDCGNCDGFRMAVADITQWESVAHALVSHLNMVAAGATKPTRES